YSYPSPLPFTDPGGGSGPLISVALRAWAAERRCSARALAGCALGRRLRRRQVTDSQVVWGAPAIASRSPLPHILVPVGGPGHDESGRPDVSLGRGESRPGDGRPQPPF